MKALVCHLCGRKYGTASLSIHLKTCKEKFIREQAKISSKYRKAIPEDLPLPISPLRQKAIDAYNEQALQIYSTSVMQVSLI